MIQPQELRIGNWVKTINDVPLKILTVGLHACQCKYDGYQNTEEEGKRISTIGFNSIYPITLTPEILKKAGFKKTAFSDGIGYVLEILTVFREDGLWIVTIFDGYACDNCQYLHQLQNLYYALTGQELQITL